MKNSLDNTRNKVCQQMPNLDNTINIIKAMIEEM